MFSYKIKSYSPGNEYPGYYFYVLNKGMNGGKPLKKPCPNCFVVSCSTEEEKELIYWLSFAIWKGGGFEKHLRGSVIPFLTISDYKRGIHEKLLRTEKITEPLTKVVVIFQNLDEVERVTKEKLSTIASLRKLLFNKYFE